MDNLVPLFGQVCVFDILGCPSSNGCLCFCFVIQVYMLVYLNAAGMCLEICYIKSGILLVTLYSNELYRAF